MLVQKGGGTEFSMCGFFFADYRYKGVGEGGAAGACAPALSKVGGHKWV